MPRIALLGVPPGVRSTLLVGTAAHWIVYRTIREDVAETLDFIVQHPDLAVQAIED